jgi:capsid protein
VLRNNPEGRAIVTRLADLVIQKGWEIAARTGDPEIDKAYEEFWREWANSTRADSRRLMTHFQQGRSLIIDAMIDGSTLVVPIADSSNQLIEVARLDPAPKSSANVQSGVELGQYDQPVAYYVRSGRFGTGPTFRLPAGEFSDMPRLFRCPHVLGANQTLGEPGLQSVIERLETLDSVIFNGALAYEIAAMIPLVVESSNPDAMRATMEAAGLEDEQPARTETDDPKELDIQPGRAIFLPTGAKAGQFKPEHPHTMMDKFVWTMVALAGADLGLPLVLVSLEFSQVNFHGGRVAMGMAELALHKWRGELGAKFASPSYRQLIANAIRDGKLPYTDNWWRHDIVWPPMPIVDLKAEFEASSFGIEKNLTTLDRETRRLGTGQWEEIVEQKGREAELQKEHGVMPAMLPGAMDPNGANDKPQDAAIKDKNQDASAPGAKAAAAPKQASAPALLVGDKTLTADMVRGVTERKFPPESAKQILVRQVGMTEDDAASIITPAETYEVTTPAQNPAQTSA